MEDAPYTKREQDAYRKEVLGTLGRIEEQTKKTNGRVSNLEERQERMESWQNFMKGGLSVLSLMVVPLLIYFIIHWPK
jgi:hypothetical protein